MRIFTNKLVPWSNLLHIHGVSRIDTSPWHTFNFYKITRMSTNDSPIQITSGSPLCHITFNNQYHCYSNLEYSSGVPENKFVSCEFVIPGKGIIHVNNICIPKQLQRDDIIAICTKDNDTNYII